MNDVQRAAREAANVCWNEVPESTHYRDVADYVFGSSPDISSDEAVLAAIDTHPWVSEKEREALLEAEVAAA